MRMADSKNEKMKLPANPISQATRRLLARSDMIRAVKNIDILKGFSHNRFWINVYNRASEKLISPII